VREDGGEKAETLKTEILKSETNGKA
jgi:hypothetical protein